MQKTKIVLIAAVAIVLGGVFVYFFALIRNGNRESLVSQIERIPGGNSNQAPPLSEEKRLQMAYETRLAALLEKVRKSGKKSRVIVQLQMPSRVLANMTTEEEKEYLSAIASKQDAVIDRLKQRFGVDESTINRFQYIPHFSLWVDEYQLEALIADPDVKTIEEDAAFFPS